MVRYGRGIRPRRSGGPPVHSDTDSYAIRCRASQRERASRLDRNPEGRDGAAWLPVGVRDVAAEHRDCPVDDPETEAGAVLEVGLLAGLDSVEFGRGNARTVVGDIDDECSGGVVRDGYLHPRAAVSPFDAVAVVSAGPLTYLFSPLNLLVTAVLSSLVGANFALSYLGLVQPRACGLESSAGVLAGFPALLSGAACCGPTLLLVIGVQASATVITGFQFLVPVALAMLVGGLLLVGRRVDPELLSGGVGR
mgnify:CR=1 FL=1